MIPMTQAMLPGNREADDLSLFNIVMRTQTRLYEAYSDRDALFDDRNADAIPVDLWPATIERLEYLEALILRLQPLVEDGLEMLARESERQRDRDDETHRRRVRRRLNFGEAERSAPILGAYATAA